MKKVFQLMLKGRRRSAKKQLEDLSRDELIAIRDICEDLSLWCMTEFMSPFRAPPEDEWYLVYEDKL